MTAPSGIVRRTVRFRGHVQGVGFRFTVQNLAHRYPAVRGYVRNVVDGSVELVVEGSSTDLVGLIGSIRQRMDSSIEDFQSDDAPATGEFPDFSIRH